MIKDKRIRNLFIWLAISGIVAVVGEIIVLDALQPFYQPGLSGIHGFGLFLLGMGGVLAIVLKDRGYYKEKYEESLEKDDTQ